MSATITQHNLGRALRRVARLERGWGADERGVDVAQCFARRVGHGCGEKAGEGVDEVARVYGVWQQRPTVVAGTLTVGANGNRERQHARETVTAQRRGHVRESSGEFLEHAVARWIPRQVQEDVG